MIQYLRNLFCVNKPKFNAGDEVFLHHDCDYCHKTTHARCRGMLIGRSSTLSSFSFRKYFYNYSFVCFDCHETWNNISESMIELNIEEMDQFKVRVIEALKVI